MKHAATALFLTYLLLLGGCSQSSQETAQQREAEAKAKAHDAAVRLNRDARKLGSEVKQEARALNTKMGNAINSPAAAGNGSSKAEAKVKHGTEDLRVEADQAGVKLSRAAVIARVKAKLATDVGLSTVTSVDVDTTGQVVTLHGTVDSQAQKQHAEQAAMQIPGVTRVVDDLTVRQ
ncbi:MAG TPA: BON domain-containing protein [Bryobacteraceae bacterium]|nr:BON domain-containing protein [Bryobacteraceae bacterium]